MFTKLWRPWLARSTQPFARKPRSKTARREQTFRPRLEELEHRWLPSTVTLLAGPTSNLATLGVNLFNPPSTSIAKTLNPLAGFTGGASVAVGDVTGNGHTDVVVGTRTGGDRVQVLDADTGSLVADFFAFAPTFTAGVTVAVGDVNGDGHADIIVGAGAGGNSAVEVIDGTKLGQVQDNNEIASGALLGDFLAFAPSFTGGVTVAAGDVNADGHADIIAGAATGVAEVKVVDGTKLGQVLPTGQIASGAVLGDFFAFAPNFTGGVNVAAGDVNADGHADIIAGAATGVSAVKVVDGTQLGQVQADGQIASTAVLAQFNAFAPTDSSGVTVAAGDVNADGHADIIAGAITGGPAVKVIDGTQLGQVLPTGQIASSAVLAQFNAFTPSATSGVSVAILTPSVASADLVVTTSSDAVNHSGRSLRDAIGIANADAARGSSDTIRFDTTQMTATTITLQQGVLELSGAGTGTETIDGGGLVTIDGNNASSVFQVDSGVSAALSGLTIAHGSTTFSGDNLAGGRGGGINNNGGTLAVADCTFVGNKADLDGGGIYSTAGTLTVTACTFRSNDAFGGGGILSDSLDTLLVKSCIFNGNTTNGEGAALEADGMATVKDSTFSANSSAQDAGAIYSEGTLTVDACTFSDNSAHAGFGGAIYASGTVTVNASSFSSNSASFSNNSQPAYGGAIVNQNTLTVTACTFNDNSATLYMNPLKVSHHLSGWNHIRIPMGHNHDSHSLTSG